MIHMCRAPMCVSSFSNPNEHFHQNIKRKGAFFVNLLWLPQKKYKCFANKLEHNISYSFCIHFFRFSEHTSTWEVKMDVTRDTSGSTGQLSSAGSAGVGGGGMHHSHSTPAGVDGGTRTPPATPKKGGKMLAIRVQMLDDTVTIFQVQVSLFLLIVHHCLVLSLTDKCLIRFVQVSKPTRGINWRIDGPTSQTSHLLYEECVNVKLSIWECSFLLVLWW